MIDINLDEKTSVLHIQPHSALTAEDFARLTAIVDPYLKQHDALKGVIIETIKFPGWANLNAFIAHVKFIKNHHAKIQKIAIVTDSKLADIAPKCIQPFIKPQIKHFPFGQTALALQWIQPPY